MHNKTQTEQVIELLLTDGYVSRNWAISNYITRLSGIMCSLKDEGWNFEAGYRKTPNGKDYVYKLVGTQPMAKKEYFVQGELVATKYVKV